MLTWNLPLLYLLCLGLFLAGTGSGIILFKRPILSHYISHTMALTGGFVLSLLAFTLLFKRQSIFLTLWEVNPFWTLSFYIDPFAAFFLLIISLVAIPTSLYSLSYMTSYSPNKKLALYGSGLNVFLLTMTTVVTAEDGFTFLLSWEGMSLVSFLLLIFEQDKSEVRRSGYIYLTMTHFGTAFIFLTFLTLFHFTGSLHFSDFYQKGFTLPDSIQHTLFILTLIGFGTKAGIVPFHVWLPRAHPVAPTPISCLMSAVMIKTALYGMLRFVYDVLGGPFVWWGIILLGLGGVSALLGILYGLLERDIKRFLAYSSVENIGVIFMGIGTSLIFTTYHHPMLASFTLTAALFHVINHAIFKGVLFMGAGAVYYATHSKNMEQLGGLIHRMPFTSLFFLIAGLSLAAFPPFNGFLSEWMTYQSLFHLSVDLTHPLWKVVGILSLAVLGLTGALVAGGVVRLLGTTFLGLPRHDRAKQAKEVPFLMNVGMGLLTSGTILLGILPGSILHLIHGVVGQRHDSIKHSNLIPLLPINISLSITTILSVLIVLGILTLIFIWIFFGKHKKRMDDTWNCGISLTSQMQYSPTSYSHPILLIFQRLFQPTTKVNKESYSIYFPKWISYQMQIFHVIESFFYKPWVRLFVFLSHQIRKIQNGNLQSYLAYMFLMLLILLFFTR